MVGVWLGTQAASLQGVGYGDGCSGEVELHA